MKLWWLNDPRRFASEKRAVDALAGEGWFSLSKWTLHNFRLAAMGDIVVSANRYPVRLVFGDQFPLVPAWVEPTDPEARWSNHQYGAGGALCLELRPDNWSPDATGADVLRSAYNLLRIENPLGSVHEQVESAHHVGAVQQYVLQQNPVLIGAQCLFRIVEKTAEDLRAVRWRPDERVWPIYVSDEEDRVHGMAPAGPDLDTDRTEVAIIVAHHEPPTEAPENREKLLAALGCEPISTAGPLVVLAVSESFITPFHCFEDGSVFARKLIVVNDAIGSRSARSTAAAGKRIGIVGAGSVGSRIAESVVRSGVLRVLLVDGDIFLPGNIERHVLDWRDVGFVKVHALKRRLLAIVPRLEVSVIDTNLDWQRSPRSHGKHIEDLAACDIIVDATGSTPTSLFLGAIAAENGRPFVSAEVYEGGIGAVIARALPDRDPPYALGRRAYEVYCEMQNVKPPTSGERRYEVLSDGGIPIVADDASATAAAAHAARLILDIADEQINADETAWLLMGFKRSWLFTQHGHNIMLDVGKPPVKVENDDEIDQDAQSLAIALAQEAIDATKSAS